MTLTTEQLRARAESLGLDFFIERRAGIWVKEWFDNGCTSATAEEVMMWSMLANREAQPVGKAEITKIAAELVRGDYLSKLWAEAEKSRHVDTHRLQNLLDELHDVMKVKAIAITRLLTAPPAPAVPDFKALAEDLVENLVDCGGADEEAVEQYLAFAEKACRAAMLAQPVSGGYKLNSPEIPDGWIACSERMPDDEQECLVQTHSGFRYVSFYDEHTGLFYDMPGGNQVDCVEHILVTHWMPLPAAPEGGNG
ncbi:DUF551 domain-containing protein [Serratia marcescens]